MRVLSPPTQITMMLRAYYEDRRWPRDLHQLQCEAGYSPPRALWCSQPHLTALLCPSPTRPSPPG